MKTLLIALATIFAIGGVANADTARPTHDQNGSNHSVPRVHCEPIVSDTAANIIAPRFAKRLNGAGAWKMNIRILKQRDRIAELKLEIERLEK